jgi:hypothetical protein
MDSNPSSFKIKRILKLASTPLLFIAALLAVLCLDHFSMTFAFSNNTNLAATQFTIKSRDFFDELSALSSTTKTFIYLGLLTAHIYFGACLQIIAKKANLENTWLAWIPILQFILLVQAAGQPSWQFLLLLVPIVNIIFLAFLMFNLPYKLGKRDINSVVLISLVLLGLSPLFPLYFFLMAFT